MPVARRSVLGITLAGTALLTLPACPELDSNPGEVGADSSYLRGKMGNISFTNPCEEMNVDTTAGTGRSFLGYAFLGGESRSLGHGFLILAPNSASALRDPSLLRDYPIRPYSTTVSSNDLELFSLALLVHEQPATQWLSCGSKDCPSQDYVHHIDAITELSKAPGKATFRIHGRFKAKMLRQGDAASMPSDYEGDWSLKLTVPDPGEPPQAP
jgi:hypothetical protein